MSNETLLEIYYKGYTDGLQAREPLSSPEELLTWLNGYKTKENE